MMLGGEKAGIWLLRGAGGETARPGNSWEEKSAAPVGCGAVFCCHIDLFSVSSFKGGGGRMLELLLGSGGLDLMGWVGSLRGRLLKGCCLVGWLAKGGDGFGCNGGKVLGPELEGGGCFWLGLAWFVRTVGDSEVRVGRSLL